MEMAFARVYAATPIKHEVCEVFCCEEYTPLRRVVKQAESAVFRDICPRGNTQTSTGIIQKVLRQTLRFRKCRDPGLDQYIDDDIIILKKKDLHCPHDNDIVRFSHLCYAMTP